MKTTLLAIAALFATTAITPRALAQDKLNIGDNIPAKDLKMRSATSGNDVSLQDAASKNGLLVIFSCNTCPFVVKNQPVTKKALAYAEANKVGAIVINSNEAQRADADSYDAMKKYGMEQGYKVPYVIDQSSKLADLFGATHTPEIYLFNAQGKLVYKGAMNDNPSDPSSATKMYVQEAIQSMIAGKEVTPAVTKSIGCSIKRKA